MLTTDLYSTALLAPSAAADKLFVVSGYASAAFARRHLEELASQGRDVQVKLIIGMPGARNDHLAFLDLHTRYPGRFDGYYYDTTPPVHSKMYGWFSGERAIRGFAGSANYSQGGFVELQQRNQLSLEDPSLIRQHFESLLPSSVPMRLAHPTPAVGHAPLTQVGQAPAGGVLWEIPDVRIRVSFLDRKGRLPAVSGINWGQREALVRRSTGGPIMVRRRANEAYLSLKGESRREGFLPGRAIRFSLITDDGHSFDCVRAQQGEKAIETTDDNSVLGAYLRARIGVPAGAPVSRADLDRYGRTDFTLEKLDPETFLLDLAN